MGGSSCCWHTGHCEGAACWARVQETDSRLLSPARQANAQGPGNFSSVVCVEWCRERLSGMHEECCAEVQLTKACREKLGAGFDRRADRLALMGTDRQLTVWCKPSEL